MITLYRCSVCGKWSHAKRAPKSHKRWIRDTVDGDGQPPPSDIVIDYVESIYGGFDYIPGGWWVRCGPFDAYEARKRS